ncbi:tRNA (adenosine(37)-N6)-threonylcarbamoyltransferase complex transferase subunit TsaD [Candidatus Gracilibacteria bacterium]|nr:tRNA (adenosine(37)-N6)-threonylcarbamoyltransferase complex transferase subunit TsaD [Candidatus Gracilibacteria bacterium]
MYILAFETSCDDTSVAIMRDDQCIALSTRTQLEHTQTGGVVPEVAARSHANAIFPCIEDALRDAHISLGEIDIIACTDKPGLMPSLLTGMTVAKTLAISLHKPLLWVDHIESHIFANYLERKEDQIPFPSIVLTVSGGHTEIYLWRSRFDLSLIGQTRDDAAGEAFDKVSKMMGLGFPGGAIISRRASMYPGEYVGIFPEVLLEKESLDFSFSGLKTAVKREIDIRIQKTGTLSDEDREQIAFEFEEVVIRTLVKKLIRAQEQFGGKSIVLAGGVSANTKLKNRLEEKSRKIGIPFISPVRSIYSMDNAAMVGIRAYYDSIKKQ